MPCIDLRQDLHRDVLHFIPEKGQAGIARDHFTEVQMFGQHGVDLLGEDLSVKRQREETLDGEPGQELPGLLFGVFPYDVLRRVVVQVERLPVYIGLPRYVGDGDLLGSLLFEHVQVSLLYRFFGPCDPSVLHFSPFPLKMCIIPYYLQNWQLIKCIFNMIIPHVWINQYPRISHIFMVV